MVPRPRARPVVVAAVVGLLLAAYCSTAAADGAPYLSYTSALPTHTGTTTVSLRWNGVLAGGASLFNLGMIDITPAEVVVADLQYIGDSVNFVWRLDLEGIPTSKVLRIFAAAGQLNDLFGTANVATHFMLPAAGAAPPHPYAVLSAGSSHHGGVDTEVTISWFGYFEHVPTNATFFDLSMITTSSGFATGLVKHADEYSWSFTVSGPTAGQVLAVRLANHAVTGYFGALSAWASVLVAPTAATPPVPTAVISTAAIDHTTTEPVSFSVTWDGSFAAGPSDAAFFTPDRILVSSGEVVDFQRHPVNAYEWTFKVDNMGLDVLVLRLPTGALVDFFGSESEMSVVMLPLRSVTPASPTVEILSATSLPTATDPLTIRVVWTGYFADESFFSINDLVVSSGIKGAVTVEATATGFVFEFPLAGATHGNVMLNLPSNLVVDFFGATNLAGATLSIPFGNCVHPEDGIKGVYDPVAGVCACYSGYAQPDATTPFCSERVNPACLSQAPTVVPHVSSSSVVGDDLQVSLRLPIVSGRLRLSLALGLSGHADCQSPALRVTSVLDSQDCNEIVTIHVPTTDLATCGLVPFQSATAFVTGIGNDDRRRRRTSSGSKSRDAAGAGAGAEKQAAVRAATGRWWVYVSDVQFIYQDTGASPVSMQFREVTTEAVINQPLVGVDVVSSHGLFASVVAQSVTRGTVPASVADLTLSTVLPWPYKLGEMSSKRTPSGVSFSMVEGDEVYCGSTEDDYCQQRWEMELSSHVLCSFAGQYEFDVYLDCRTPGACLTTVSTLTLTVTDANKLCGALVDAPGREVRASALAYGTSLFVTPRQAFNFGESTYVYLQVHGTGYTVLSTTVTEVTAYGTSIMGTAPVSVLRVTHFPPVAPNAASFSILANRENYPVIGDGGSMAFSIVATTSITYQDVVTGAIATRHGVRTLLASHGAGLMPSVIVAITAPTGPVVDTDEPEETTSAPSGAPGGSLLTGTGGSASGSGSAILDAMVVSFIIVGALIFLFCVGLVLVFVIKRGGHVRDEEDRRRRQRGGGRSGGLYSNYSSYYHGKDEDDESGTEQVWPAGISKKISFATSSSSAASSSYDEYSAYSSGYSSYLSYAHRGTGERPLAFQYAYPLYSDEFNQHTVDEFALIPH